MARLFPFPLFLFQILKLSINSLQIHPISNLFQTITKLMEEPNSASFPKRSRKYLSPHERHLIFQTLLQQSEGGRLKKGTKASLAEKHNVSRRTIYRIWKIGKSFVCSQTLANVSTNVVGRAGRKRISIDFSKVAEVPLRRRTNIRSLAKAIDVSKSTLHRRIKSGSLRRHTNAIKPHLTDENKKARVRFCLSMLKLKVPNNIHVFDDMRSYVHIDEKWFYMSRESEKYYLLPEEEEPTRTCKSKRFITKVMFLAAVARPRYDDCRGEEFSGKIGIFPLTYKEPAKRSSKNRAAGTMETKAIQSVTKEVIRSFLIEKVLPAIRSKWPTCCYGPQILIQQDNAKPHVDPNDEEFLEAAKADGFDIQLCYQPANSPDLNVLDLGFFRAIQSLQHQEPLNSIDDLVAAVEKAFNEISSKSLDDIFLTLQKCMIEILKSLGGNSYKLPHIGKQALRREGNLPLQLECDEDVRERALLAIQSLP